MIVRLTGTAVHDGTQLHRVGAVADLPEVTARRLVARGDAEEVQAPAAETETEPPTPAPAAAPAAETEPEPPTPAPAAAPAANKARKRGADPNPAKNGR